MRFVSRYGEFGVQIRPQFVEAYATGGVQVTQQGVYAMFHVIGTRPEEVDLAKERWHGTFNGFYQQEDEVTILPPDYRLGSFDSEQAQLDNGWSDEIRDEVERTLIELSERFNEILVVPATLLPPPWPNYDNFEGTLAALMRKVVDDGYELENVLGYERAMQNRPDVVVALEELIATTDEIPMEEVVG